MDDLHNTYGVVGEGSDERGCYKITLLSMLRGGKPKPYKVYAKPIKHIVNDSAPTLRGWYKDKNEPPSKRPRPCYTEALLTTPYGGYCPVGCKFCYVSHGTRGYRASGIVTVNPDYPDAVRRNLSKMYIGSSAYISSFIEPFLHLEKQYHVTQRLSQVFVDVGLPIFYLTRLIPPDWAIEYLLHNPYSYMQWSINTSNEKHRKLMSPGTASLDDMLSCIGRVRSVGIYVSIQCNPVLAGITTLDELVGVVKLVAEAGANHIIFKFVEQVYSNRALLFRRLSKLPGVDVMDKLLSQRIGGCYTIRQDVRIEWLRVLLEETRKAGITMSTCYEYYDDGTQGGANLAPWFTTADQCHGLGVPVHYRLELGEKFRPLPGCWRKGCLYCNEYGTKVCNSELLLSAKALKCADYRERLAVAGDAADWLLPDSCAKPSLVKKSRAANPDMMTDAELWGWGDISEYVS